MEETRFDFIKDLALEIQVALLPHLNTHHAKAAHSVAFSGDTTFAIDKVAESALLAAIERSGLKAAYFSEDKGLVKLDPKPEWLLVVDPIDGTRPLVCGFETAVVSLALCHYSDIATFGTIIAGVVLEINSGIYYYAEQGMGVRCSTPADSFPCPSQNDSITRMFWGYDTICRPVERVMHYLGTLIDQSGLQGASFQHNSSAYSLTRIVTGQLDAYVDVGGRILSDFSESEVEFEKLASGRVVGMFPYDIAGAYIILKEANCVITDACGKSLDKVLLVQHGKQAVISCLAASNRNLHRAILGALPSQN